MPKKKKTLAKYEKKSGTTVPTSALGPAMAYTTGAYEDTVPEIINSSCESEEIIVVEERPIKEIIH